MFTLYFTEIISICFFQKIYIYECIFYISNKQVFKKIPTIIIYTQKYLYYLYQQISQEKINYY